MSLLTVRDSQSAPWASVCPGMDRWSRHAWEAVMLLQWFSVLEKKYLLQLANGCIQVNDLNSWMHIFNEYCMSNTRTVFFLWNVSFKVVLELCLKFCTSLKPFTRQLSCTPLSLQITQSSRLCIFTAPLSIWHLASLTDMSGQDVSGSKTKWCIWAQIDVLLSVLIYKMPVFFLHLGGLGLRWGFMLSCCKSHTIHVLAFWLSRQSFTLQVFVLNNV